MKHAITLLLLFPIALNAMESNSLVKVDNDEMSIDTGENVLTKEIRIDATLSTNVTCLTQDDLVTSEGIGLFFKLNHEGEFQHCDAWAHDINNLTMQHYRTRAHLRITSINQNNTTIEYKLTYAHQPGKDETITNAITIPIGCEQSIYLISKGSSRYLAALTINAVRREPNLSWPDVQANGSVYLESLISGNHNPTILGSIIKYLTN